VIGFGLFTVIKILTSILVVVVLSLIAERIGPRFAGIVAGYPLGAAISLFFIGLEIDPEFASRSAIFTAAGLAASVAFVGGYLLGLHWAEDRSRPTALILSILPALAAYALAALLISAVPISRISATAIAFLSIVAADRFFRTIPNALIAQKIRLSFSVTLLRAVFAAAVILAITTAAGAVGSRWAGLFSAFPITMLPLLIIIQITYRPAHVRTIIRNVPRGLGSLLAYTLTVSMAYPRMGIAWGTLLGYLAAPAYLIVLERVKLRVPA
jgi:hypothetical protein